MWIDTRIIERHAPYEVLAQRHEIMFHDGSVVHLHPVHVIVADGKPEGGVSTFLRAVQTEGLTWSIFDLRHVARAIDDDLQSAHWHDQPGIVFHTLRLTFGNAPALLAAVADAKRTTWWREAVSA